MLTRQQLSTALERYGAIRLHFTDTDSTALLRRTPGGTFQLEGYSYEFRYAEVAARVAVQLHGGLEWIEEYRVSTEEVTAACLP